MLVVQIKPVQGKGLLIANIYGHNFKNTLTAKRVNRVLFQQVSDIIVIVSYTRLGAKETVLDLVCRLLHYKVGV